MTPRQSELFTYIQDYVFTHGYSPTLEEMRHKLNLGSIGTVHEHLRMLVKQGYLKRNGYKRGYELPAQFGLTTNFSETVTNVVGSSVFNSLSKSGISKTEVTKITKQVKDDLARSLKEKKHETKSNEKK